MSTMQSKATTEAATTEATTEAALCFLPRASPDLFYAPQLTSQHPPHPQALLTAPHSGFPLGQRKTQIPFEGKGVSL